MALPVNSPDLEKKSLSRVAQKRLKVKEEILSSAASILSDQGVENLTLAAVTENLGLTKPAIYHYFRSKEDLVHSLVLDLLQQETVDLIDAVSKCGGRDIVLGTLIRAFYLHYRTRLNAFRLVYCQFQLMDMNALGFDQNTMRRAVNPLSKRLFDIVVSILNDGVSGSGDAEMRRLAFSSWLAAVGLVEMLAMTSAAGDPLSHSDEALLDTMESVYNNAVRDLTATVN